MLSHEDVWAAIDALAKQHKLTPSGLARKSGLDPTSFNKSKRITASGRARWPSTESIAKALKATGATLDEFMGFIPSNRAVQGTKRNKVYAEGPPRYTQPPRSVPLLGFAQAGAGGFFDDGGFPAGQGWDEVPFPADQREQVYALEVSGDSMMPLYRDGDVIIVAPAAQVRKGDRVVLKTCEGEVMAKLLARQTTKHVELKSLNPEHDDRVVPMKDIEWIARILWASQ